MKRITKKLRQKIEQIKWEYAEYKRAFIEKPELSRSHDNELHQGLEWITKDYGIVFDDEKKEEYNSKYKEYWGKYNELEKQVWGEVYPEIEKIKKKSFSDPYGQALFDILKILGNNKTMELFGKCNNLISTKYQKEREEIFEMGYELFEIILSILQGEIK